MPDDENRKTNSIFYDKDAVGRSGPIHIGYACEYSASHQLWHKTLQSLGVKTNMAHLAGSNVGAWTNLGSVDPVQATRSYSATAYYVPNASRPNLVLITEAFVTEAVLEREDDSWRAKGVRFQRDGDSFFVGASREVILSAGSVQSPQILEISGIGSPDILERAGIDVKFSNLNVGENLQDHISK